MVEARCANLGTGRVSDVKAGKIKKRHYKSPEISNLDKTLTIREAGREPDKQGLRISIVHTDLTNFPDPEKGDKILHTPQ